MRLEDIEFIDETDKWDIYNEIAKYIPQSAQKLIMTAKVLRIVSALCFFPVVYAANEELWILAGSVIGAAVILLITSFLFDVIADISISTARTSALIALQTKMML